MSFYIAIYEHKFYVFLWRYKISLVFTLHFSVQKIIMLTNRLYDDKTEGIPKVLHTIEEIPLGGYFTVFYLISDVYIHPETSVFKKDHNGEIV